LANLPFGVRGGICVERTAAVVIETVYGVWRAGGTGEAPGRGAEP
jgi:hypothetical protein